jgi:hypothetical protein
MKNSQRIMKIHIGIDKLYRSCRYHKKDVSLSTVRPMPWSGVRNKLCLQTNKMDEAHQISVLTIYEKLPFHQKHWTYDPDSGETERAAWFK